MKDEFIDTAFRIAAVLFWGTVAFVTGLMVSMALASWE